MPDPRSEPVADDEPPDAREGAAFPEGVDPADESDEARARERAGRRRRVAEIFGDVLPESTRDDLDPEADPARRDADLRREVPPHHV